jgi:hypothetical protein
MTIDVSVKDFAALLGVQPCTVYTALYRARNRAQAPAAPSGGQLTINATIAQEKRPEAPTALRA